MTATRYRIEESIDGKIWRVNKQLKGSIDYEAAYQFGRKLRATGTRRHVRVFQVKEQLVFNFKRENSY